MAIKADPPRLANPHDVADALLRAFGIDMQQEVTRVVIDASYNELPKIYIERLVRTEDLERLKAAGQIAKPGESVVEVGRLEVNEKGEAEIRKA